MHNEVYLIDMLSLKCTSNKLLSSQNLFTLGGIRGYVLYYAKYSRGSRIIDARNLKVYQLLDRNIFKEGFDVTAKVKACCVLKNDERMSNYRSTFWVDKRSPLHDAIKKHNSLE